MPGQEPAPRPTCLLSFGEALVTLGRPTHRENEIVSGGTELNVCCALARCNPKLKTNWASILPAGTLGKAVEQNAKDAGVNTILNYHDYAELGALFLLHGKPLYQRRNSAFNTFIDEQTFDWEEIIRQVAADSGNPPWIHLTGITPVLSAGAQASWKSLVNVAIKHGRGISLDLNHRPALSSFDHLWDIIAPYLQYFQVNFHDLLCWERVLSPF